MHGVIEADCLAVMAGLVEGSVDLAYADPPFGTGRDFGDYDDRWPWDAAAQDASRTLPDALQRLVLLAHDAHSPPMAAYLCWLAPRVQAMRRVLADTGSLWLHCDTAADGYIRVLLDCVMGKAAYRNAVAWCYASPSTARNRFPRKHDTLYWYSAKGDFHRDAVRVPVAQASVEKAGYGNPASMIRNAWSVASMRAWIDAGKVVEDWWPDISPVGRCKREIMGYKTQKPERLLRRILKACTQEGDLVLEPFCGSGTACAVAKSLNRRWLGIDANPEAVRIARARLEAQPQPML